MLGPGALIYIVELKLHCLAQIPQFLSKYLIFLYLLFNVGTDKSPLWYQTELLLMSQCHILCRMR